MKIDPKQLLQFGLAGVLVYGAARLIKGAIDPAAGNREKKTDNRESNQLTDPPAPADNPPEPTPPADIPAQTESEKETIDNGKDFDET